MKCYSCRKYDTCQLDWKCSADMYFCSAYEVEQTNEEWRKTCSAEEFTEELTKVVLDLVSWNNDPKPSEVRNILKSWLKQPHTGGTK
jgi:hypothetical protein